MSPTPSSRAGRVFADFRPDARSRHRIAILVIWGLLAVLPAAAADTALPDLGDAAGETLTRAEEERLGDAFLRQVRQRARLVDDPEVVDYIDSLGQRIATADPERRYRFLVVDAPTVNAFAGPGGVIAVNAGLIVITESESELAAVIAHEIAHVTQRHLAQLIERSRLASLSTLAGVFAGILIATQNPEAGQATLAASAAGAQHAALSYSREKEMEADRTGMELLHRAGFDPRAVPAFFERFQEWQRFTSRPPEFLSTHPVTVSRIADTRGRAEQFEPRPYHESAEYPLVRAKLRMRLAANPADALEHFEARVADGGSEATEADRYGLAIALMSSNRHEEASRRLEELRRDFPDRAAHRTAAAQGIRRARRGRTGARASRRLGETVSRSSGPRVRLRSRPRTGGPSGRRGDPSSKVPAQARHRHRRCPLPAARSRPPAGRAARRIPHGARGVPRSQRRPRVRHPSARHRARGSRHRRLPIGPGGGPATTTHEPALGRPVTEPPDGGHA